MEGEKEMQKIKCDMRENLRSLALASLFNYSHNRTSEHRKE